MCVLLLYLIMNSINFNNNYCFFLKQPVYIIFLDLFQFYMYFLQITQGSAIKYEIESMMWQLF